MSYHNGSVWPHDTSMAVSGMAHYGERDAVAMILGEIYTAASHFHMRLPELFCGFEREPGEGPIAYPVACLPQAWAAGSVFLMLQAALGVHIDAFEGVVTVAAPMMPSGIDRLTVTKLQVGAARVDLNFQRIGDQTVVMPRDKTGDVRIVTTR
jgi:glycogen debranching enzyme